MRDKIQYSDIEFKDSMFQADPASQSLLTSSIVLFTATGSVPEGFKWKASDNSLHSFTLQDLIMLGGAIATRLNATAGKSWGLKDRVDKATTKEEIEAIQW